jgi:hypothetical protein
MGDSRLVLNSIHSEAKLVVSENSASLYSEVCSLKASVSEIYFESKSIGSPTSLKEAYDGTKDLQSEVLSAVKVSFQELKIVYETTSFLKGDSDLLDSIGEIS